MLKKSGTPSATTTCEYCNPKSIPVQGWIRFLTAVLLAVVIELLLWPLRLIVPLWEYSLLAAFFLVMLFLAAYKIKDLKATALPKPPKITPTDRHLVADLTAQNIHASDNTLIAWLGVLLTLHPLTFLAVQAINRGLDPAAIGTKLHVAALAVGLLACFTYVANTRIRSGRQRARNSLHVMIHTGTFGPFFRHIEPAENHTFSLVEEILANLARAWAWTAGLLFLLGLLSGIM